jgi:hypothetical protein
MLDANSSFPGESSQASSALLRRYLGAAVIAKELP